MLNSRSMGNKIAEARKKLTLSQAELAKKVSISPQAVGKWERGESLPDISTLSRLADILGVDLNYFSEKVQPENTKEIELVVPISEEQSNSLERPAKKFDWNWDMSKGNWADADFSGLKNLKEKFSSSNMKNCNFSGSDLSGLILGKNNIELCDFTASDLRGSRIQSSNLLGNRFTQCSFIDAEIQKSNISQCDFSRADFSGTEFIEVNFEKNILTDSILKFTAFKGTNLSEVVFSGEMEDCHFENCAFYSVKFQEATIRNTFFKYNRRFKKVQFIDCKVDKITYAFLKNNEANLTGICLLA